MNTDITSLQAILDQLYQNMLPLCAPLMGVSQAIAGFLALWTIAYRVWGHLARAEPVDPFPLLRPFALGMAILLYPALLGLVNGVMRPVVLATDSMVQNGNQAVQVILQRQQADTTGESLSDEIEARLDYRTVIISALEYVFEGASLILRTLRTFILTVLSILGPLVLGISVSDPFRHSFHHWLARYINVSLWVPVANIYGAMMAQVQALMLQANPNSDFAQGQGGAYIVFLLMGIAGYACVPSTAGYIVQALGGHAMVQRANALVKKW